MSKKIAVLTEETIHDLEFWYPYYRLAEEGYDLVIVGPEAGKSYTGKMGGVIRSEKSPSEIFREGLRRRRRPRRVGPR